MADIPQIEPGRYRHAKSGKEYEVIGVALDTETEQKLAIYRPLYDCPHEMFARPATMFCEYVSINGMTRQRFEKIEDS